MECPSPQDLERLAAGRASADERGAFLDHASGCTDCHAMVAVLTQPLIAPPVDRIGRYELVRELGRGASGVVYEARDPELSRAVAVKVLRPLAPAQRLRREAQALAKLAHPNVVRIYDVGEHAGQTFIAMELVAGTTLRAWLGMQASQPAERSVGRWRRRGWEHARTGVAKPVITEIARVLVAAGRGLAAAHRAGLVHRDFKPDNVLIADSGAVLVGDFGLARLVDERDAAGAAPIGAEVVSSEWPSLTSTGALVGTPAYMAPEQAVGDATAQSDQFAFAVTLWEACFGRRPFDGTTLAEIWHRARAGLFHEPESLADRKAATLVRLLRRALAADPTARFSTLDGLLDAIERVLSPRRAQIWFAAGGVGLAVAVGLVAGRVGGQAEPDPCAGALVADAAPALRADDPRWRRLARLPGFATQQPEVVRALADRSSEWRAAHHAACVAHHDGRLSDALHERRVACLARARASLAATVDLLETTPFESFAEVRTAVAAIAAPGACELADASPVPPPEPAERLRVAVAAAQVERARMFAAVHHPSAIALAVAARAEAGRLAYRPLRARAALIEGRARMGERDDEAARVLESAVTEALAAGDDVTAVEAFARRAYERGVPVDALVIEGIAARLGAEGDFARRLLHNNLAAVALATGDLPRARAWLAEARRGWSSRRSENDLELISILFNLALVSEEPATSLALIRQARGQLREAVGPDHPKSLEAEMFEATFEPDLAAARALREHTCGRLATLYPALVVEHAECRYEAGWLADEAGDAAAAGAHFGIAATLARGTVRGRLAQAMRDLAGADPAELERTAAAEAAESGVWHRIVAFDAFVVAGRAWQRAGRAPDAVRCWRRALAVAPTDRPLIARRLARLRRAMVL